MDDFYKDRIRELMASCKPCPFCGESDLYYESEKAGGFIWCNDCGAEGPTVDVFEDAIDGAVKAWNWRIHN